MVKIKRRISRWHDGERLREYRNLMKGSVGMSTILRLASFCLGLLAVTAIQAPAVAGVYTAGAPVRPAPAQALSSAASVLPSAPACGVTAHKPLTIRSLVTPSRFPLAGASCASRRTHATTGFYAPSLDTHP